MASKAKITGNNDSWQRDGAVAERERSLHSSREQEIRIRACEIYCSAGGKPAMSWRIGCRPNASSQHRFPSNIAVTLVIPRPAPAYQVYVIGSFANTGYDHRFEPRTNTRDDERL
jgi:hypothetical protein